MEFNDYCELPYTIEIIPETDNLYFVAIKELPGCMSMGDSIKDAIKMIEDAKRVWLRDALRNGEKIPIPLNNEKTLVIKGNK